MLSNSKSIKIVCFIHKHQVYVQKTANCTSLSLRILINSCPIKTNWTLLNADSLNSLQEYLTFESVYVVTQRRDQKRPKFQFFDDNFMNFCSKNRQKIRQVTDRPVHVWCKFERKKIFISFFGNQSYLVEERVALHDV